ncbi:uncharacterized protein [Drosophila bipectinata]|uniref:uncharacterized protein n=1 Tax=Drosophila bipectinata TaxID=42026 RepID=UPI0038B23D88
MHIVFKIIFISSLCVICSVGSFLQDTFEVAKRNGNFTAIMYSNFFYLYGSSGNPTNKSTDATQLPTYDSPDDDEPDYEPGFKQERKVFMKTFGGALKQLNDSEDSSTAKPLVMKLLPILGSYQGTMKDSLKTTTDMGIPATPVKVSRKKTNDAEKPNTTMPNKAQTSLYLRESTDSEDKTQTETTSNPKYANKFSNYVFLSAYDDDRETNSTDKGNRSSTILTPVLKTGIPDI